MFILLNIQKNAKRIYKVRTCLESDFNCEDARKEVVKVVEDLEKEANS